MIVAMGKPTKTELDKAIGLLDPLLALGSDEVKEAWRIVRTAARRGRRISSRTLPRVADVAQHAVAIREALDAIIGEVPAPLYQNVQIARDHACVLIETARTGAESDRP